MCDKGQQIMGQRSNADCDLGVLLSPGYVCNHGKWTGSIIHSTLQIVFKKIGSLQDREQ